MVLPGRSALERRPAGTTLTLRQVSLAIRKTGRSHEPQWTRAYDLEHAARHGAGGGPSHPLGQTRVSLNPCRDEPGVCTIKIKGPGLCEVTPVADVSESAIAIVRDRQRISRHSTKKAIAGGSSGARDDTTSHPSRPSRLSSRSFFDRRPCHSMVQYSYLAMVTRLRRRVAVTTRSSGPPFGSRVR